MWWTPWTLLLITSSGVTTAFVGPTVRQTHCDGGSTTKSLPIRRGGVSRSTTPATTATTSTARFYHSDDENVGNVIEHDKEYLLQMNQLLQSKDPTWYNEYVIQTLGKDFVESNLLLQPTTTPPPGDQTVVEAERNDTPPPTQPPRTTIINTPMKSIDDRDQKNGAKNEIASLDEEVPSATTTKEEVEAELTIDKNPNKIAMETTSQGGVSVENQTDDDDNNNNTETQDVATIASSPSPRTDSTPVTSDPEPTFQAKGTPISTESSNTKLPPLSKGTTTTTTTERLGKEDQKSEQTMPPTTQATVSSTEDETTTTTRATTVESSPRMVIYRGFDQKIKSTLLTDLLKLGYPIDEITSLQGEVLGMIIEDNITRPRLGIPPQWKVPRITNSRNGPTQQQQLQQQPQVRIVDTKEQVLDEEIRRMEEDIGSSSRPQQQQQQQQQRDPVKRGPDRRDSSTAAAADAAATADNRNQRGANDSVTSPPSPPKGVVKGAASTDRPVSSSTPETRERQRRTRNNIEIDDEETLQKRSKKRTNDIPPFDDQLGSTSPTNRRGNASGTRTRPPPPGAAAGAEGLPPRQQQRRRRADLPTDSGSTKRIYSVREGGPNPRSGRPPPRGSSSSEPPRVQRGRPIQSNARVRQRRPKPGDDDPPPPTSFWPDMNKFRDLLRNEENFRLQILGRDWTPTIKQESDFRLGAYKKWLWALHNGVGSTDMIVPPSRYERARRVGERRTRDQQDFNNEGDNDDADASSTGRRRRPRKRKE